MLWVKGWVVFILLIASFGGAEAKPMDFARQALRQKGRAQAAEMLQVFSERLELWQSHPGQTWDEAIDAWAQEVAEQDPTTYKEAHIAALLAAQSPRLGAELVDFLTEHGALRFANLNDPLQKARDSIEDSHLPLLSLIARQAARLEVFRPSVGRRFWEFVPHVRLPRSLVRDPVKCEIGLVDFAGAVFRGTHEKPAPHAWLKAFRRIQGLNIMNPVAESEYERYYGAQREYLRQVASESLKLPPAEVGDVVDRFYNFHSFKRPLRGLIAKINKKNLDLSLEGSERHRARVEKTALTVELWVRGIFTTAVIAYGVPKLYERQKHKEKIEEFEGRPLVENGKNSEKPGKNADFENDQKKIDALTEKLSELRKQGKSDPALERQIEELQKKMEGEYDSDENEIHP